MGHHGHCQISGRRGALFLAALLCAATPPAARAAEFFYLDHDSFSGRYVGPVGPLVMSGDIEAGDAARMLARIGEDVERFLAQNAVLLASTDGDVDEALKIGELLRSMDSEVTVGAVTGPCTGPCFLIYAAASRRASGGSGLLGIRAPLPEAALAWLRRSETPPDWLDAVAQQPPGTVHRLTDAEELRLGGRSASFARELAARCAWDDAAEREVLAGRRAFREFEPMWTCRTRLARQAARGVLQRLLKPGASHATAP